MSYSNFWASDVDMSIRRCLDPLTRVQFYAALYPEKGLETKIVSRINGTLSPELAAKISTAAIWINWIASSELFFDVTVLAGLYISSLLGVVHRKMS